MELTEKVYMCMGKFPAEERFGLVSQMKRAVVSIPSNIAEGHGRSSTGAYIQHLTISKGSLCELETQLEISRRLGYIPDSDVNALLEKCTVIKKQLAALIKSLKTR